MNDTTGSSNQDQAPEEKESVQEMLKDINEFVLGVSKFPAEKKEKLMFAFRIYDIDNDGYISNGELFQVLKMMVGSNLKDTQLQQIVDKTILFADKDEDGKINFEEFCEVVGNTDVHKKMVVDV